MRLFNDLSDRTLVSIELEESRLPELEAACQEALKAGVEHWLVLSELLACLQFPRPQPRLAKPPEELPLVLTGPGGDYRQAWPRRESRLDARELIGGDPAAAIAEAEAALPAMPSEWR